MKMRFLTNAMIPGTLMMPMWGLDEKPFRSLTLTNHYCKHHKVSKLILQLEAISAISDTGDEHKLVEIEGGKRIEAEGPENMVTFLSRRTLTAGAYKAIRFYFKGEKSCYYYSDGIGRTISDENFIEFSIEGGLQVDADESPKFKMNFELLAFEPVRSRKPVSDRFWKLDWLR